MSRPPGMDSCVVSIRKRCWVAGDCMIEELPSCCPRRSIGHVCCRWQRGIDICRLQQCSSGARSYADNVLSGSSCGVGGWAFYPCPLNMYHLSSSDNLLETLIFLDYNPLEIDRLRVVCVPKSIKEHWYFKNV